MSNIQKIYVHYPISLVFAFLLIFNISPRLDYYMASMVISSIGITAFVYVAGWLICRKYGIKRNLYCILYLFEMSIPCAVSVFFCMTISVKIFGYDSLYIIIGMWAVLLAALLFLVRNKNGNLTAIKIMPAIMSVGIVCLGIISKSGSNGDLALFMVIDFLIAYGTMIFVGLSIFGLVKIHVENV